MTTQVGGVGQREFAWHAGVAGLGCGAALGLLAGVALALLIRAPAAGDYVGTAVAAPLIGLLVGAIAGGVAGILLTLSTSLTGREPTTLTSLLAIVIGVCGVGLLVSRSAEFWVGYAQFAAIPMVLFAVGVPMVAGRLREWGTGRSAAVH